MNYLNVAGLAVAVVPGQLRARHVAVPLGHLPLNKEHDAVEEEDEDEGHGDKDDNEEDDASHAAEEGKASEEDARMRGDAL